MKRKSIIAAGFLLITLAGFMAANALTVGQELSNVNIKDASNNPSSIPDFGSKILTVIYCDTDTADIADPISDALKAKDFPRTKSVGCGIANLKDSFEPNWIIRAIIKRKIAKYHETILTDVDNTVAKSWGLGNCNDKSVFIILGKDKKIKYTKTFDKKNKPAQSDIDQAVNVLAGLVNSSK